MRNKELKMKLGQLQDEISKTSLPVSADLCNNFKSIILETDQRKIYTSWGWVYFKLFLFILLSHGITFSFVLKIAMWKKVWRKKTKT